MFSVGNMQNNKSVDEEKGEPKENARMVENNEREKEMDGDTPPSRWDHLSKRAKHFASNRYNVIIVLLCILLLIFFIVIIGLAARLGSYRCPEPVECRTSECLSAAASVVERSDFAQDPCKNFWSYSCGGWFERNQLPKNKGSISVLGELKKSIYSRIRHLIDLVPHDANLNSPQHKLKNFYTSCINLADIEYWVPQKLTQAIQEIGGWAILNRPQSSQWKRNDVLKKLHVMYGVPVFFRIIVEADDSNPLRNIVKLIPDGLGLPSAVYYEKSREDPYVKAYKELIQNLMQQMDVPLHESGRFADDIFYYEKRLAGIMPEPEVLRNTSHSYHIMKVKELDKLSTSVSWSELLQMYFPNVIRPDTEIAVLSKDFFSDLSLLISATDSRLLNDYYMWRFVLTYMSHLSSRHRMVSNRFKQTFEGVGDLDLQHEERWEFCIGLTSHYMGYAVGSMYIEQYVPAQLREELESYVYKIVGALTGVMKNVPWLVDQTSHNLALEKVLSLVLELQYPHFNKNCSLEEYYNELNVQADYFQNLKDGIYFLRRKQEQMLKESTSQDCSWPVSPHDVAVSYMYSGNRLVVPAGLLDLPLFDFSAPLAKKYGVLAGHVANKLSKMFDDKGINYETYGILKPWMSAASLDVYQDKLKCLHTNLVNYSVNVPFDPDLTLGSFVADIAGVKLAYKAYKRHVEESSWEGELPGMDVDNDQLFFISYAQSLCEVTRYEKLRAYKDVSQVLPAEIRVMGALQQLPEFYNFFSCDVQSEANSIRICQMW